MNNKGREGKKKKKNEMIYLNFFFFLMLRSQIQKDLERKIFIFFFYFFVPFDLFNSRRMPILVLQFLWNVIIIIRTMKIGRLFAIYC